VTGSRQTGKSTLVRQLEPERPYVTLDDIEVRERAREAPGSLVGAERITLDEVQRAPDLLLAVKREVDRSRRPGRFVLTGSANLLLMKQVAESLAGRSVHLTLWPLTRRERLGQGRAGLWTELLESAPDAWETRLADADSPTEDWRAAARVGGFPTPALELADDEARELWFGGFVQTYLERDLRDVSAVASLAAFRRLLRATALRIGNLVNQADLARDVALSPASVHRHLDLMLVTHQLVRLEPWLTNRTTRLIKSPKLYWNDSALAMHLAGEEEPRGAHLENMVVVDALAWAEGQPRRPGVHYWRTSSGREIDLVIESGRRLLPVEIKTSERARMDDARVLDSFVTEHAPLARAGLLLHAGDRTEWMTERVLAAPWWRVV
jgi:predicted AAA+ superfamily ATPase